MGKGSHLDLLKVFGVFSRFIELYNNDLEIIIRPHPSEDHKIYQNLFKSFENIRVDNDSNLYTQILQADAIIVSSGSTTALEAAMLSSKPLMYFFLAKQV